MHTKGSYLCCVALVFFLLRIDFNEEDDFRISTTLWSDYMDHIE